MQKQTDNPLFSEFFAELEACKGAIPKAVPSCSIEEFGSLSITDDRAEATTSTEVKKAEPHSVSFDWLDRLFEGKIDDDESSPADFLMFDQVRG